MRHTTHRYLWMKSRLWTTIDLGGQLNRPGTLTAMPDDERADERASTETAAPSSPVTASPRRCSACSSVAAIVLAVMIWSGHRADTDERRYQTEVLKTAADWTNVLINMNKDDIDASLQKLHDGTVGELNNEFESAVEPYKKVVQTLQSRTKGQIDSVAVESIYHRPQTLPDGRPGARADPAAGAGRVGQAHRHRAGGGDVDQ